MMRGLQNGHRAVPGLLIMHKSTWLAAARTLILVETVDKARTVAFGVLRASETPKKSL